ncbi:hypothetical protein HRbin36_01102 [bacterium HR36]|nr:hypothetical protein HRbin36_01102 [bacterium HR36]
MRSALAATASLTILLVASCWSLEPWLPEDISRAHLLNRMRWPIPKHAVHLRWYDLTLPIQNQEILEEIWREADEQILAAELRPVLRGNGLRVGILADRVPASLGQLVSQVGNVQVLSLLLTPGQAHFQPLGARQDYLACPVSYGGECAIAEFASAQPGLCFEIREAGDSSLHLAVIPAVRHQPTTPAQWLWGNSSSWPLATGETETRLAFLAVNVQLSPKDLLVLGATNQPGPHLGAYLFNDPQLQCTHIILVRRLPKIEKNSPSKEYSSLFPSPGNSTSLEVGAAIP